MIISLSVNLVDTEMLLISVYVIKHVFQVIMLFIHHKPKYFLKYFVLVSKLIWKEKYDRSYFSTNYKV